MKNKILYGLLLAVLAFAVFGPLMAFYKSDAGADAFEHVDGVGDYATFDYRNDTITNAEKDTLFIGKRDNSTWNTVTSPTQFLSLYTYDISILRASLSGTHNVKVYLDKSNTRYGTSTDWFTLDSTSATTATLAMLRSTDATGARYRLRINGTGTQSSTFTIWSIWKKKN